MLKYKLLLSYDGTNYGGWQVQKNAPSIQALLQEALLTILRKPIPVIGSGRTDAGVHALGQVAHICLDTPLIERKVLHSLNGLLPEDIRIISLEETDPSFHARYSATGKIYHYHLHLRPVLNPFTRLYSFQVPFQIDLALMQQATSYFLGTKDFSSFANEPHLGAAAKNGVRTMKRLDIIEEQDGVCLAFEADGFLYKMVRNITGTLLDVAAGKIPLSHLPDIFAAKDRKRAGRAAPPQGLFLMRVYYS